MALFSRRRGVFSPDAPSLEPLYRRVKASTRVVISESRDWLMVASSLAPGEVQWARIPATLTAPDAAAGEGFLFLTDRQLIVVSHSSATRIPLGDVRGVRVVESGPPKASHATMKFDLELSSADGVYLELVATADARDVAAFYPTVVHAARNAPGNEGVKTSAENRPTGPQEAVWGTARAVAVARPGHGYSGVGDMTLTEDGDLVFTPDRDRNSRQRFRLDEPDVWMRVDDEASDWPQAGIDGSMPVIVISARAHDTRFYLQPGVDPRSFDDWVARLRQAGGRQHPSGWSSR